MFSQFYQPFTGTTSTIHFNVDPVLLRIAQAMAQDPYVRRYCHFNGIRDPLMLRQKLMDFGKARYVNRLRALGEATYRRIEAEEKAANRVMDEHIHKHDRQGDFEVFHVRIGDRAVYQCNCGLLIVDACVGEALDQIQGSAGHRRVHRAAPVEELEPMEAPQFMTLKVPLCDVTSEDGVTW